MFLEILCQKGVREVVMIIPTMKIEKYGFSIKTKCKYSVFSRVGYISTRFWKLYTIISSIFTNNLEIVSFSGDYPQLLGSSFPAQEPVVLQDSLGISKNRRADRRPPRLG